MVVNALLHALTAGTFSLNNRNRFYGRHVTSPPHLDLPIPNRAIRNRSPNTFTHFISTPGIYKSATSHQPLINDISRHSPPSLVDSSDLIHVISTDGDHQMRHSHPQPLWQHLGLPVVQQRHLAIRDGDNQLPVAEPLIQHTACSTVWGYHLAPFAHEYVPGVGVGLEVAVAEDHVAVGGGQVLQNAPGPQRQQRVCELRSELQNEKKE